MERNTGQSRGTNNLTGMTNRRGMTISPYINNKKKFLVAVQTKNDRPDYVMMCLALYKWHFCFPYKNHRHDLVGFPVDFNLCIEYNYG